jgi:hypothetical protein
MSCVHVFVGGENFARMVVSMYEMFGCGLCTVTPGVAAAFPT